MSDLMADFTVTLNTAQLLDVLRSPSGPVAANLLQTGNRVLNRARELCPVDQGPLRASLFVAIRVEGGTFVVVIGSNLHYAVYVHEGTGIHAGKGYIVPINGQFLRWPMKNNSGVGMRRYKGGSTAGYVYARRVAGVKARPFLRDALAVA